MVYTIDTYHGIYDGIYHGIYDGIYLAMYHGIYTGIYHPSFNGIYHDIYHGIYHDLTDTYHLTLPWLHWTACSHLLLPTACYSYCILSPGTPQRSGLCFNEHITGWTANRCCSSLYATAIAYAAASAMRRPVLVRAVHKWRSIPHAKYGFFHVKHLHISQQCLVEQLHRDRCNFVWRDNYEMRAGRWRETWSCINGAILWATWNAAPQWSWRVAPRSSALFPSLSARLRILWQQVRTVRQ